MWSSRGGLTEQQFERELDEPFERVTKSHGIRYTLETDVNDSYTDFVCSP